MLILREEMVSKALCEEKNHKKRDGKIKSVIYVQVYTAVFVGTGTFQMLTFLSTFVHLQFINNSQSIYLILSSLNIKTFQHVYDFAITSTNVNLFKAIIFVSVFRVYPIYELLVDDTSLYSLLEFHRQKLYSGTFAKQYYI